MRLLSPQHWAKTLKRRHGIKAKSMTMDITIDLEGEKEFRQTIPLDQETSVVTIQSAPGMKGFTEFETRLVNEKKDNSVPEGEQFDDGYEQETNEPHKFPFVGPQDIEVPRVKVNYQPNNAQKLFTELHRKWDVYPR